MEETTNTTTVTEEPQETEKGLEKVKHGIVTAIDENGNGEIDIEDVTEEIIPSKRNPRKAKVSYTVTLGNPMLYDSIEYRNFSPGEDRFISGTLRKSNIVKGEQFSVPNLTAERNRLSALLRDNGYYYYQSNLCRWRSWWYKLCCEDCFL